jgi:hypothetical protein
MPPRSPACNDVADWLDSNFITGFVNEGDPVLWTPRGDKHYRGFFAIPLITLTFCEAMSALLVGSSHGGQELATRFLEDRVSVHAGSALVEGRYRTRSALLFNLYRNGIAHQREPGRLNVDRSEIMWETSRGRPLENHLRLARMSTQPPVYRLTIDVDLLYKHVLAAFHEVSAQARQTPALARKIYSGLVQADTPRIPRIPRTTNSHTWAQMRAALATFDES